ncbi:MAG: hypothetical protein Edafosvirus2_7 [Edafosvirus sp.]|uniref:Ankyrin repeat protein n=1 Tax=Edafosvirus sp. TaxID=2487765 RepID=A0A3G4ZSG0_9VIRU|nr:MAG: hypothetical protein Edafosvirus2_7 [Edafosvirus sp.]
MTDNIMEILPETKAYYENQNKLDMIWGIYDEIMGHDERKSKTIKHFINCNYTIDTVARLPCGSVPNCYCGSLSLYKLIIGSKCIQPKSFNFMIKMGINIKDDMKFLEDYMDDLETHENWLCVKYLIMYVYTPEKILKFDTLYDLMYTNHFDEAIFTDILQYFEEHKFNMTTKSSRGVTLLDRAIWLQNTNIIDYFLNKGCKFAEGAYNPFCGIINIYNTDDYIDYRDLTINEIVQANLPIGCNFVQRLIFDLYEDEEKDDEKFEAGEEENCFQTILYCINKGYNINSKDKSGYKLKDYVITYICPLKHPIYYERYMQLL